MVDQRAVLASDASVGQRIPDGAAKRRKRLDIVAPQNLRMLSDQKKPVATPRHIARHHAVAVHVHRHIVMMAVGRHVVDRDAGVGMQLNAHNANRRIDAVPAHGEAAEESERGDHADHAVAAHAQVADIVKEDDCRAALGIVRRAQQRAHHHVRTARLAHSRRADMVEIAPHAFAPLQQRSGTQVRAALGNEPGRLAAGVRIDDGKGFHYAGVSSLRPNIPATMRAMQPSRSAPAGSPSRIMPAIAVPTVPMPVQMA